MKRVITRPLSLHHMETLHGHDDVQSENEEEAEDDALSVCHQNMNGEYPSSSTGASAAGATAISATSKSSYVLLPVVGWKT